MKKIIEEIRDILTLMGVIGVYGITGLVILIYLLYWAFPEVWFLGSMVLKMPDLRLIIVLVIGLSWGLAMLQGFGKVKEWQENWKTKLAIAWMLAYFAKYSFSVVGKLGQLAIPLMIVVFFYYLNTVINFMTKITLKELWLRILKNRKYLWQAMGISMVIAIVGGIIMVSVIKYQQKVNEQRAWLSDHPTIERLEPKVVFPSNKILIIGDHFGWKENEKVRLVSSEGEVRTDLWTNEKIIFQVPWSWKNKTIKIWIEKERKWKGKTILDKSKVFEIKVLSVDNLSKGDEKLYYQEMKSISKEAKELNGY